MPFARVGVMPQPVQTKQRNARGQGGGKPTASHQKGITMEDLKKQTALRLAQEQQQTGSVFPVQEQARERPFRPLSEHQVHGYAPSNYPPADAYPDQFSYQNHPPPPNMPTVQPTQQNYHQTYQPPPPPQNSNVHLMASYENYSTANGQTGQYFDNKRVNARNQRNPHVQAQHANSTHQDSRSPNNRYMQDQRSLYPRSSSAPNGLHVSQPFASTEHDSSIEPGSNSSQHKLPHGLTVHELKEMTKARLQAEGSDKYEGDSRHENRRVSPLDFDSGPEIRERAMSRDSASRNRQVLLQHGNASDSMSSIPSMVQVNQSVRDPNAGRQRQVSPLPPGLQNLAPLSTAMPGTETGMYRVMSATLRDSRHNQLRVETWETASVTSHNSTAFSENQGSESGFGSGILPQTDSDLVGIPFGRSRSYPAVPHHGDVPSYGDRSAPPSAYVSPGGGNSFFDNTIGAVNRRRACTMSPKPGSIHEDRPQFNGEELRMPSFSSSSRSSFLARSRNNYSPVLPQLGMDRSFLNQNQGLMSFGDGMNRPRTSSAVSLPPISSTAEEFAFTQFAAGDTRMRTDSMTEVLSSSFRENFAGYPLVSNGREGSAFDNAPSSVFRDGPMADRIPAPPGFSNGSEVKTVDSSSSFGPYTGFSRVGSADSIPESNLSSTWGVDGSLGGSTSFFGSVGPDESPATTMGSILKLSGVPDRPDRERSNTYPHTSTSRTTSSDYFSEEFVGKESGPFRY